MQFETQGRYPASSDVVLKMFTDKDFHVAKMNKLGIRHEILQCDSDGDEFIIKAERAVPVQASGIVKKIMPATTQVVNDERWRLSDKSGSVVVQTKGVPLDMSCTAQMHDEGDECVITYKWNIKAKIPLGGGALEKFVRNDMEGREAEELEAGISFLDDYR